MPKTILITHQKGGVGKSTLVFNLAQNISNYASVCVIDLDKQGTLFQLKNMISSFDIKEHNNISDIKKLDYDFILIDTPPYLSINIKDLAKISDIIVIPTLPSIPDLMAINKTIEQVGGYNCLIVLNRVKPNTNLTNEIKEQLSKFNTPIAKTMISDYTAISRSLVSGGVESHKKSKNQIDNLTQEVLTKI